MSFLQPLMLVALPLIALPILIHLINQWRYQSKPWGAMMFLLAANRMNRGFARIRQWLILAMRTLVVAGLIFAVARPLASGLLGLGAGGQVDTTVILMDRSPSMQVQGPGGLTKLDTGRRQLAGALDKLGSKHWVTVDAAGGEAVAHESLEAALLSPALTASSATSDLAGMLQAALEYLKNNQPGPTEVWICSDLRQRDWNADSGTWSLARDGFKNLPQSVRFHLLAYPDAARENLAVRVTQARRESTVEDGVERNALLLSLQLTRGGDVPADAAASIPVQIEIEGNRTEIPVELSGLQTDVRNLRIPLPRQQESGWGTVSLPADQNNADNDYYFVFAKEAVRRIVVVSDDRQASRALELAAAVSADGEKNAAVEVISPQELDSLVLDDTALLLWQTTLPDQQTAPAVEKYINEGGQVIFFPPALLVSANQAATQEFMGVRWNDWQNSKVLVDSWRGDQDLLAATRSGVGLPVGQLQLSGYARLSSTTELSSLASLTGGAPLLTKLPTAHGGVYFCSVSVDPKVSSLAESGVVLYVAVQRAIEQGQEALGNITMRAATASEQGVNEQNAAQWRQLAGSAEALSTELSVHAGVYQQGDRLFAINRTTAEDRRDQVPDQRVEQLFAGLPFARVDGSAGDLTGILREVWRVFLMGMILAMLLEALLCLPRRAAVRPVASRM